MTHTRLWIVASIIAGVILVIFFLSAPHTHDLPRPAPTSETVQTAPNVSVHDVYRKGMHTLTGSVQAPTPCTTISTTASATGTASSTDGILVAISMPPDTGICVQQIATLTFTTTVAAPAGVPIRATVNGVSATVSRL